MIEIFGSHIIRGDEKPYLNFLKKYYGNELINRLDKAPGANYRCRRITSRLMLIAICDYLGIPLKNLASTSQNKNGKFRMPDVNVSISYTDNIALCLVSDSQIGLDVENIKREVNSRQLRLMEQLLHMKIMNKIEFYKIWTKIESIVKAYENKCLTDVFYGNLLENNHITQYCLFNEDYLISASSIHTMNKIEKINFLNTNKLWA
jgi:hypothetical protein